MQPFLFRFLFFLLVRVALMLRSHRLHTPRLYFTTNQRSLSPPPSTQFPTNECRGFEYDGEADHKLLCHLQVYRNQARPPGLPILPQARPPGLPISLCAPFCSRGAGRRLFAPLFREQIYAFINGRNRRSRSRNSLKISRPRRTNVHDLKNNLPSLVWHLARKTLLPVTPLGP